VRVSRQSGPSLSVRCPACCRLTGHAWQSVPFVERFIGSGRRECLDHVIVFNEAGPQRLMTLYCSYHERSRTHLSLDKDPPIPRPVTPPAMAPSSRSRRCLHHRYERRAA
jgi:hypothetical protein